MSRPRPKRYIIEPYDDSYAPPPWKAAKNLEQASEAHLRHECKPNAIRPGDWKDVKDREAEISKTAMAEAPSTAEINNTEVIQVISSIQSGQEKELKPTTTVVHDKKSNEAVIEEAPTPEPDKNNNKNELFQEPAVINPSTASGSASSYEANAPRYSREEASELLRLARVAFDHARVGIQRYLVGDIRKQPRVRASVNKMKFAVYLEMRQRAETTEGPDKAFYNRCILAIKTALDPQMRAALSGQIDALNIDQMTSEAAQQLNIAL